MTFGPGSPVVKADPVAQQQLREPVTSAHQVDPDRFAGADQVAQRLLLGPRHPDRVKLPRQQQPHQMLGVTAIGLHAIPGTDGHQRRRDDVARDADSRQQPQQVKPAGPRLIAGREALRASQAVDEPADRPLGCLDPMNLWLAARWRQRRRDDRELMHVERDPQANIHRGGRANVRHGLVLLRMRHWPQRSLTTATLTRDTCERRGPARFGVHTD